MSTMKAIVIENYGGADVLQYKDVQVPSIKESEVLVRIHAASVNPIDWKIREGLAKSFIPVSFPFIPGCDFSGTIERVGSAITQYKIGDEVYGFVDQVRSGALAQYVAAKESEIALKPKLLDHVAASAIPVVTLAAWQSLFDLAKLESKQKILIHAAAGAVGSMAVQLAKWKNAYVFGTASTEEQDFLRELCVDEPIDYKINKFEDIAKEVDIVFDTVGGETRARSWKTLKKGGILVTAVGPAPSDAEANQNGVRQSSVHTSPNSKELSEIAHLIDLRKLKTKVATVFTLENAPQAQALSQKGGARGKIVIEILKK